MYSFQHTGHACHSSRFQALHILHQYQRVAAVVPGPEAMHQ